MIDQRNAARALFSGSVVVLAGVAGLDPAATLAADPRANRPANPTWNTAMKVQRQSLYLAVTSLGCGVTLTAEAVGVTKALVSKACREIEALRDEDAALTAALERAERLLLGGVR